MAYCGRHEVRGDQVVHHIEQSLFPNWLGTNQQRFIKLDGNRLTLTTDPAVTKQPFVARTVWESATGTATMQVN
jgi:hypothetical protein